MDNVFFHSAGALGSGVVAMNLAELASGGAVAGGFAVLLALIGLIRDYKRHRHQRFLISETHDNKDE